MDKLTMAHEYALKMLENLNPMQMEKPTRDGIVYECFELADAMQTEADKRKITAPDEISKHERLIPFDESHVHDYIYGRVCACGAVNGAEKEWQPDTYPEYEHGRDYPPGAWVTFNGEARLAVSIKEDSLRKRPQ